MKPETLKAAAFIDRLDPTTRRYVVEMVYRVAGFAELAEPFHPELENAASEAGAIENVILFPGPRQ